MDKENRLHPLIKSSVVHFEYDALAVSQKAGNSESFIEFMLNAILQASEELPARRITDIFTDKLAKAELEFLEQIAGYIDKNGEITNYRAQLLTNKSDVSVKKYSAEFVEIGILRVERKNQGRKCLINRESIATETVNVDEQNIIVVIIPKGKDKPYKDNRGIIWVKNGSDKTGVYRMQQ